MTLQCRIVIFTFPSIFAITLFAQAPDTLWTRTYGGTDYDYGESVQQTYDGGYIIAGITYSFGLGPDDVYLIKTDSLGDTLWTRTYGGPIYDGGLSVQQTSDSGYIVTGLADGNGSGTTGDIYLIKTDSIGDTLWTRKFGGLNIEVGSAVKQTIDEGYIVAGFTLSFGPGTPSTGNIYLIKTDSLGDTLWTKVYGGMDWEDDYSVQQTSDSGYIITGFTTSFGAGGMDVYLIKTDSLGDTLWTKTFGGSNDDWGNDVQETPDGGYIIVGAAHSFGGASQAYLIKTDANGDTLWTRTYGGMYNDTGESIQQLVDGSYIIVGTTMSFGAGDQDVYLFKTDSIGNLLWTKTVGGIDIDGGHEIQKTSDDGYIIVGNTKSFGAGLSDFYLIKIAPDTLGITENQDISYPNRNLFLEINQNPFIDRVIIKYSREGNTEDMKLEIYNSSGQLIKQFDNLLYQPSNQVIWNGTDDRGNQLPSGVYFVRLEIAHQNIAIKLVKLR